MFQRLLLALSAFTFCLHCSAQTATRQSWTDKNNAEESAAYMIRIAYYDLGYMGASVRVRQDGAKRTFEVDPGRVYHIKELRIAGHGDLPAEALATAPKSGDIYSAGRLNEWIALLKSRYKKTAGWGVHLDHAKAQATIEVSLDGESLGKPKD